MGEVKKIKVSEIVESKVALRAVNEESEAFMELVASVREKGLINPISVRPLNEGGYCLIDGLHRFTACKALGLEEIPVHVMDVNEAESLELQLIGNIHKVETKPVEYAKQLRKILGANPSLTLAELAGKIGKSSSWLIARLGLLSLGENIQSLVDEGAICLNNAYALSKLPESEQANFMDRAMTSQPEEFLGLVKSRISEIQKEKREGKTQTEEKFVAVPVLRKLAEIKQEFADSKIGEHLVKAEGCASPMDGWKVAMKWILNMDSISVEKQQAKFDARKKALEEAKEKRRQEAAKKKVESAAAKAAKFQEEAEKAKKALEGVVV